jgi:hypothetical protein
MVLIGIVLIGVPTALLLGSLGDSVHDVDVCGTIR